MKEEDIERSFFTSNMKVTSRISQQKYMKLVFIIIIFVCFVWFLSSNRHIFMSNSLDVPGSQRITAYSANNYVNTFSNDVLKFERFQQVCYGGAELKSIEDLSRFLNMLENGRNILCQREHKLFKLIYLVRIKYTTIVISTGFMKKVRAWLNNDEKLISAAKNQSLIFVDNLFTSESVVYNPVRANRPGASVSGDLMKYINDLVKTTKQSCDFCSYANNTAADSFGRMESSHSVVVSNTFKIDKYHGLVLMKTHNPLYFNQLQFIDAMHLSLKWFAKSYSLAPNHPYRTMYWDVLPKASASQVHPHIHLTLGDSSYYAKWNHLYKSALLFANENHNQNYWNSVLQVHAALGLTLRFGDASMFVYLTPQKDYEVVVIANKPCLDFFRLAFFTYRAFVDVLGQYALSLGFVFPKIPKFPNSNGNYGNELPMLMRIISRGAADGTRADVSSFDLFGTPNVNKDPFVLMRKLREPMEKKMREEFSFPAWTDVN